MASNFLIKYPSTISSGATAWDCGREPRYIVIRTIEDTTQSVRKHPFRLQLEWDGVSDAQRALFLSAVASYADLTPFVLYDGSNYVLDGRGSITARLTGGDIVPRVGGNLIRASFEEVL